MARIAAGAVDTSRHDSILRRENSSIPNKHFLFYIKIDFHDLLIFLKFVEAL